MKILFTFVQLLLVTLMLTMFRITTLLLVLIPFSLFAQYNPGYWSLNITASTSNFLSDLGGKNAIGTNDFTDLELTTTRLAIGAGFMYHTGAFGIEIGSFYTQLAADDNLTAVNRGKRMLNVKTDLVETYLKFQLTFPSKIPVLGNFYMNVGGGFIYFDPKTEYNGEVYKLRPLGTEGQNYRPGMAPYAKFAPVIPFGIGRQFILSNGHRIAVDLSMRKSFTDYLDDVSTTYADPIKLAEKGGGIAAELADRSDVGFSAGDQRGDPSDMDNYFLLGVKYTIPLGGHRNYNTSCAFGNSWIKYTNGGRKFKHKGRKRRRRIFR